MENSLLKRSNTVVLLAAFVSFILMLTCLHPGQDWGDDFALYISECKALINGNLGQLYEDNKFITDHSETVLGPHLYPIGFPLLLVPIYKVFGLNFIAFKIYLFLFFSGSVFLFFKIIQSVYPEAKWSAVTAAVIMAFNHNYFLLANNITSDVPFMFFSFLALYSMLRPFNPLVKAIVTGLLCFFSFSIREAGIALLLPLIVLQLQGKYLLKRESAVLQILPYAVFCLLYALVLFILPRGNENLFGFLREISLSTVTDNLYYYFAFAGRYFITYSTYTTSWMFWVAAVLTVALILVGCLSDVRKSKRGLFIYAFVLAMVAIYILWPFRAGFRFLIPIFPFLVFYMLKGIRHIPLPRKLSTGIILALLAINITWGVKQVIYTSRHSNNSSYTPEMKTIYAYIDQHTSPGDVIAYFKPRALYLFTGRLSVNIKDPVNSKTPVQYALIKKENFSGNRPDVLFETENFVFVSVHQAN